MRRALIAVCVSGVLLGATTGSAGAATIAPTAGTNFGSVEVNTQSPAKKFTLTLGMEAMFNPAISVDPPFQQSNDCGILTPLASNCSINVTFSPTSGGPAQGTLKAGGNANTVLVTGTGVEPAVGKKCKKKKGKKSAAAAKKCKKGKKKK